MTTALAIANNNSVRERLIEREKSLISKTQVMLQALVAHGGYSRWTYQNIIQLAKERLKALEVGLIPVRLGGQWFHLRTLLNEGQYIPPQIVAKVEEVRERLPKAEPRVYGWERDALPATRRRRDPVLTFYHGDMEFFGGFWLEINTPDEDDMEFFGIVAPLLEKRGRGRPRKLK